jgi:pimeloyl-ACP methyl ester carboxylesterase
MAATRPCVLVHGGWCGGWHWDCVAARLRARGLRVEVPTLPGMAERGNEATSETGLHAHVDDVAALIERENLRDVVLVGHSYGGAVVTGVAHRCGERIAELVYLDAFVPQHGESLADILGSDFVEASRTAARNAGTPHLIPPMFSVEASVGWTGQRAADHAARMCGQPIATAFDRMHAPGRVSARRSFIACTAQPLGLFDRYIGEARASTDWLYFELPCPHDAVHTMPAAVAGIIETLATP